MLGQEVLGHRTGRSLTRPGWRGLCLSRENTLGSVAGPRGSMTGMGWEDMNLGKCPGDRPWEGMQFHSLARGSLTHSGLCGLSLNDKSPLGFGVWSQQQSLELAGVEWA